MSEHETIADIIAEMRGDGHTGPADALEWVRIKLEHYADRLEAAYKRERETADAKIADLQSRVKLWTDRSAELVKKCDEQYAKLKHVGDCAKLREALVYLIQNESTLFEANLTGGELELLHLITNKARAALAAPPRNCDVGTSDEQAERFENFCLEHIGCAEETGGRHCIGCPLEKASRHITQKCELYWAQMPYEEGGDDGK